MKINNIIVGLVGVMVCAIMIGGAFLPAIDGAVRISDPITEYNIGTGQTYREARAGDIFELNSVYDADTSTKIDTWTLNGEPVLNPDTSGLAWNLGIVSDAFWIEIYDSSNSASCTYRLITSESTDPLYIGAGSTYLDVTWTITFGTDVITWVYNGGAGVPLNYEMNYTWAFVPCPLEDGGYMSSSVTSNTTSIIENIDDVVLCGSYTTGELDTNYYYYKGESYVSVDSYIGENTTTMSLREGTYDLYNASIKYTVSNGSVTEEFSPYKALVPYEVHGHADGSPIQSMLEVLPIVAIAGLIMAGIYVFISRK